MGKTIIISNRLPIKIERSKNSLKYKTSEGGLATGLNSFFRQGDNLWIGWPGLAVEKAKESEVYSKLTEQHMKPVFLSNEEIEDFYEGFSNETLWPNFHYFNQHTVYKEKYWLAYQRVNQKFAKIVAEELEDDDTLWINDYQLLLLPQIIRIIKPNSTIGFFLHIPFPSYESFRRLPWRRELLNGMLGSDFLGFHTYDDMRHFLSSVNRLAGLGNSNGTIKVKNRLIKADALPMGIDYEKYATSAQDPNTLAREARYRKSIGDVRLILSIDRLDYSIGIPQRLRAFELFLIKYPDFKEKVSLFMVVVPSRDSVSKYKQLKEEIDLLVGRINGRFSKLNWTPIHYFYRSFPLPALSAFYRISDVALVSPMRDGMNLVCKEYVASRLDRKGVLILSEMAGASKELSDAIIVNPHDIHQLVDAIYKALTLPVKLQIESMTSMQKSLKRYNIHAWVKLFMDELANVKIEQSHLKTKLLDNQLSEEITYTYKKSDERLIFLDYDGTLVGFNENPNDSRPDQELKEILTLLTKDKKNHIVIISGRDRQSLEKWMKPFSLDIVAEHGVWIKRMHKPFKTFAKINSSWKKEIMSLLEKYVNRTPGSFVEEKDYSLVWHYRKVETGLGEVRTRELTSHLKYMTANENLQVLEGDMIVEIKNSEINKGKAVQKLMKKYPKADFLLAFGDDFTDEDTFKVLPKESFTIKVGTSASEAKFSVNSYRDVRKLLRKITKN